MDADLYLSFIQNNKRCQQWTMEYIEPRSAQLCWPWGPHIHLFSSGLFTPWHRIAANRCRWQQEPRKQFL